MHNILEDLLTGTELARFELCRLQARTLSINHCPAVNVWFGKKDNTKSLDLSPLQCVVQELGDEGRVLFVSSQRLSRSDLEYE